MIFLTVDLDSPKTEETIARFAEYSDADLAGLLEGVDKLEAISNFTLLDGAGINVNAEAVVDNDGVRYTDVVFVANTKFTLDGYVYFANSVFAVSLRKNIEDVIAAVKANR